MDLNSHNTRVPLPIEPRSIRLPSMCFLNDRITGLCSELYVHAPNVIGSARGNYFLGSLYFRAREKV